MAYALLFLRYDVVSYFHFKRGMEIKSVRNSASGIADQRPYSPNFTCKIVRNSCI